MLRNYFKIAIAVLKRRKFFTFISLFGISLTLTILIVATAYMDKLLSPDYPDYKRDRSLYITGIEYQNSKEGWINRSDVSYYFLDHYVSKLKNVYKIAISSGPKSSNAYVNNKKLVIAYKYTNAAYWDVLEYNFLEGKPFSQREIDNAELITVISKETKEAYFGNSGPVVGKYISADNINYRVIGVVDNVSETLNHLAGDMYLPYTLSRDAKSTELMGAFNGILLAKSKAELPLMKNEFNQMVKRLPLPSKEFDRLYCNADSFFDNTTRSIAGDSTKTATSKVVSAAVILLLLFLLLPTINLVNINITRILERSSEIGVRKAFGASSKTLVLQFLVENLILTFFGALIGLCLSSLVIYVINEASLISNMQLKINFTVLFYSLIACIFFGLISGVYPAWLMSRLNVVKALKG
ncbi:MAG: FtsX-like permease family protein [Pedobacter sp.]